MIYLEKITSKYHAKSSYYNGYYYMSKLEAGYAKDLDLRKKAKDIKDWIRQFKVSIDVKDYHICNYYVDFRIKENDGSYTLVETKGFETEVWHLKRKLLEAIWLPKHKNYTYIVEKQKSYYFLRKLDKLLNK